MPFWPTSVSISPTSKPLVTTILVSVSEERCFKWLAEIITWIVLLLLLLKSFIHLPIHPVGQKTFLHQVMSTGLSHRDLKTNETRSRAWNSTVFKRNNRHRAFHARGRARWQWDGGGGAGVTWEQLSLNVDEVGDFRRKEPKGKKSWNVRRFRETSSALVLVSCGLFMQSQVFCALFSGPWKSHRCCEFTF